MFVNGSYTCEGYSLDPRLEKLKRDLSEWLDVGTQSFKYRSSTKESSRCVIDNPARVMMSLINYYRNDLVGVDNTITIEHNVVEYPPSHTTYQYDWQINPPVGFTPNRRSSPTNNVIKFVHVAKSSIGMFQKFDEYFADEKHISTGLQTSSQHRIRVYKPLAWGSHALLVVTNTYTWELYRQVVALLPLIFPDLLGDKFEEVKEIFEAYGASDFGKWIDGINTWITSRDLVSYYKRALLIKCFQSTQERRIRIYTDSEVAAQRKIREYEDTLRGLQNNLRDLQYTLLGIRATPAQDNEEVVNYILNHKHITAAEKIDSIIILDIETPLEYWDDEPLNMYFKNPQSSLNTIPQLGWIFKKIFKERVLKIQTHTRVHIDLSTNKINAESWSHVETSQFDYNAIMQPHLMRYNCWGNNRINIERLLTSGDYIEAIEQILAACKNLNFVDSTVVSHLISTINNTYLVNPFVFDPASKEWYNKEQLYTLYKQEKEEKKAHEANQANPGTSSPTNETVRRVPDNGENAVGQTEVRNDPDLY